MRTSTRLGCVMVALSALLALGALVVASEARHGTEAAPVATVASCLGEVRRSISCACISGGLRHDCLHECWQAMRECCDSELGADAGGSGLNRSPAVWCAPRTRAAALKEAP